MFDPVTYPHVIEFSHPHTGTATSSVKLRAPDFGESKTVGRNQLIKRTRAGYVTSYDRGKDLNEELEWSFSNVTETERANLIAFFDSVTWGASKVKLTDWLGNVSIVRLSISSLQQQNARVELIKDQETILWNFQIKFIDLTDNIDELGIGDETIMASALGLHIADQDSPHNPLVINTADISDGAVALETVDISTYRGVVWIITASKGTANGIVLVYCSSDRDYDTPADATTIKGFVTEFHEEGTDLSSALTFSAAVSGTGASQVITLSVTVSTDGWTLRSRRIRL